MAGLWAHAGTCKTQRVVASMRWPTMPSVCQVMKRANSARCRLRRKQMITSRISHAFLFCCCCFFLFVFLLTGYFIFFENSHLCVFSSLLSSLYRCWPVFVLHTAFILQSNLDIAKRELDHYHLDDSTVIRCEEVTREKTYSTCVVYEALGERTLRTQIGRSYILKCGTLGTFELKLPSFRQQRNIEEHMYCIARSLAAPAHRPCCTGPAAAQQEKAVCIPVQEQYLGTLGRQELTN